MNDKLTPFHKVLIITGEFILTPLLGAVMYYIWRRNYPSCARFANISAWCVFGCLLMAAPTLNFIRSSLTPSPTIIKANEIAKVHPSEQIAMKALYEGIEGMAIEEDGHISTVAYSPINIFGPAVTDAETEHLAKLRELRVLLLPLTNNITDLGLGNLALLTKLEVLQLGMSSGITEAGIENLKSLKNLQALGIPGAAITDRSIEHLGELTELRQIDLTGSKVGDDGMKHIEGLVKLETLALVSTQLTDVSMEILSRLPMLGSLDVRGCNITDAGLESLSHSPQLTKLIAFQTKNGGGKITDEGIKHLANIKTLKYVNISGNLVTEIGVNALRQALPDCKVETRVDAAVPE